MSHFLALKVREELKIHLVGEESAQLDRNEAKCLKFRLVS